MGIPLYQVDAFTRRAFSGNPAKVCVLPRAIDAAVMQSIAGEMNLSETAFLEPAADHYGLRWFTPKVEVNLCGHATLASAHILWETGRSRAGTDVLFETKSGRLTARQTKDGIELDFPAVQSFASDLPQEVARALGVLPVSVMKTELTDFLIEVDSEQTVRGLTPDFALLGRAGVRGVIVTSRAHTQDYDFVSRFFAPGSGINEDPVTGSAHCALAVYWHERLGKAEFSAYQASERGGELSVTHAGDRVRLIGHAVTVECGELTCEL